MKDSICLLFSRLTDACPAGYFAAELGDIKEGDVVVVFGAGPVGLFAARPGERLDALWAKRPARLEPIHGRIIDSREYRERLFSRNEGFRFSITGPIATETAAGPVFSWAPSVGQKNREGRSFSISALDLDLSFQEID